MVYVPTHSNTYIVCVMFCIVMYCLTSDAVCCCKQMLPFLSPQYATRSFSDMNFNPSPERTWSLSSKEVKALSHASGSDYVYALTEDEVSGYMYSYPCYPAVVNAFTSKQSFNTVHILSHLSCSNPLPPPSPRSTVSQWRSAPTSRTAVPASQMEACCVAGAVWRTSAPGDPSVPTATVLMV